MNFSKISIVGLGYIGLPTATVIASRKQQVVGIDISQKIVNHINNGEIHIVEPGLDTLVKSVVEDGYLRATTVPEAAEVFVITVPTPLKSDMSPDLSYIESACQTIAPVIKKGDLIILESTSPVGTTEQVSAWLDKLREDLTFPHNSGESSDVRVAYSPERILPGHAINELVSNDRIIGGITPKCSELCEKFYEIFVEGDIRITNSRVAEMSKLSENAFRDANIAFVNELSIICDKFGIDVAELVKLANSHPRVNILNPGPGVGGHCISVDPWFIVSQSPNEARLIRTAREVNDDKPKFVVNTIKKKADDMNTKDIVCLGIAFKADIDDLRESPSIEIVKKLSELGYNVQVVEPNITELPKKLNGGISLISLQKMLENSDKKVITSLVAHKEFKESAEQLLQRDIVDFCGLTTS